MKVIGNGSVHIYSGSDECFHAPGSEALWQESVVLYLWDIEQKVYVYLRLSQEPNRDAGYTTVWLNVWTPEYIYKHTDDSIPLRSGDKAEQSLCAGDGLCRYAYDGNHNWSVCDRDAKIELIMKDDHPGFGYYAADAGFLSENTAKNHIEATGTVTGSVTISGKTYKVAGTGWRDHSWGKRNWRGILAHRFYPAMFGREFNFFCATLVGVDGSFSKSGTVIMGDTVQQANDFDIVAYMDEDGVSNCGGKVTLRLDGETHVLNYETLAKSAVTLHQGFLCVDGMCRVTMGDKVGVGVSETSNRAQGGTDKPHVFPHSSGILKNGIFPTY